MDFKPGQALENKTFWRKAEKAATRDFHTRISRACACDETRTRTKKSHIARAIACDLNPLFSYKITRKTHFYCKITRDFLDFSK